MAGRFGRINNVVIVYVLIILEIRERQHTLEGSPLIYKDNKIKSNIKYNSNNNIASTITVITK